jgi:uncharacterized membrane protein YtjA (UPF0391 family)
MLRWTMMFVALALIAALLGFGEGAQRAADVGKILFFGFLILAAASIVANMARGRTA